MIINRPMHLSLKGKEIRIIHDLMTQWGSKIIPENWACTMYVVEI